MATDVSGSIAAGDEPDHELVLAAVLERIPVKWGRYIYCGRGWFGIVARLDAAIAELVPDYEVHQVKEKFGGLRFYWELPATVDPASRAELTARIQVLVDAAEIEAGRTCEACGAPGVSHVRSGFFRTLCRPCGSANGFVPSPPMS